MRIIVQTEAGGPEVLKLDEHPTPTPGAGEVLIKVMAAGVNPVDVAVRSGAFALLGEPPFTVGWDIAGKVEALGDDVTLFAVGDRVFGLSAFPNAANAYADYAVAKASEMTATPSNMTDLEAGAMPLAGLTALQGLVTYGGLKSGQRVFVHSGAGGVGHLAVQIAKALGAYVVATASAGKVDLVKTLGADEVIDYQAVDFTKNVENIDLVFDPQAGEQAERSLAITKPGGIVICLLQPSDKAVQIAQETGKRVEAIMVSPNGSDMNKLASLVTTGELKVLIAKYFPLAEASAAHAFLDERKAGKVVLQM